MVLALAAFGIVACGSNKKPIEEVTPDETSGQGGGATTVGGGAGDAMTSVGVGGGAQTTGGTGGAGGLPATGAATLPRRATQSFQS